VAEAFIENPLGLPFVNHIDCARDNNNASNLEWCTQWQNLNHSQKLGRMQRDYWIGKRSPSAKLSNEAVARIRNEYASGGISWEALAKKFSTNKRTVGRIVAGESYV
jgi:ribosome-binding protein aMBF1 (putative translation factor)